MTRVAHEVKGSAFVTLGRWVERGPKGALGPWCPAGDAGPARIMPLRYANRVTWLGDLPAPSVADAMGAPLTAEGKTLD